MAKLSVIGVAGLSGQPTAPARTLMNSDEELVERSRRGDDAAFGVIFERFSWPITGFIFGLVGERGLAEELAQETFVRAHRRLSSLRDPSLLSTWLFGIARNVAREALRARQKEAARVELADDAVARLSDARPTPAGELLDKELAGVVRAAFSALDEDKRLVFTLKVYHQHSYEEIAAVTGFSLPKVRNDLHRARAEMRRRLSRYMGAEHEM